MQKGHGRILDFAHPSMEEAWFVGMRKRRGLPREKTWDHRLTVCLSCGAISDGRCVTTELVVLRREAKRQLKPEDHLARDVHHHVRETAWTQGPAWRAVRSTFSAFGAFSRIFHWRPLGETATVDDIVVLQARTGLRRVRPM